MSTLRRAAIAALALGLFATSTACTGAEVEDDDAASTRDAITGTGPRGTTPAAGSVIDCPVLVVGGGTGGMAAALAATRLGIETCVTEQTDWVGGQFTAQGLNASDEHRYIDTVGATRSFAQMRALMRAAYGGKSNPGGCWVSHLCAEPKVALDALETMAKGAIDSGKLSIFYGLTPSAVETASGRVSGVELARNDGGKVRIRAKQTIDATELGDVIKLSGTAYRIGQEPKSDTGEADAPVQGCATCIQSITYDVILEKRPAGERHVIAKPEGYGEKPWMKGFGHASFKMFGSGSVWEYRRIVDGAALGRNDVSIMNWGVQLGNANVAYVGGNDFPHGSVVDVSADEQQTQFGRARERALAYVYWLQTAADGRGYPFLKLRSDMMGTTTGVGKYPYIREGRRIRPLETITAEHISDHYNPGSARAHTYPLSVGIGLYPMDMHQNVTAGTGFAKGHSLPFQVPLGALIPETMNGLLAGAKNIGTTHLTNSAYRLHPIEWTIGEAAGTLAAMCVSWNKEAREVFASEGNAREVQDRLLTDGVPLYWIDDVLPSSPLWKDIQLAAAVGIMGGPEAGTLHFEPEATLTRAQSAVALGRTLGITIGSGRGQFTDVPATHWASGAIEALAAKGIVSGTGNGGFTPDAPVTSAQMRIMIGRALGDDVAKRSVPEAATDGNPMSRGNAARALARAYRARIHLP